MISPWRVRNSSAPVGSGQSSTSRHPPGSQGGPGRSQHLRGVVQLVERVLEIGQVVVSRPCRAPWPWPGGSRCGPTGPRRRRWRVPGRAVSASNSTPTSSRFGKRRAIATSHRPPPQWTSTTRPPRDRSRGELRQRREGLLEEDGDVLAGEGLDGDPVACRSVGDRRARPEEVGHPAPVHRGDDGVDELAAEEIGAIAVEQDGGDVLVHDQAAVLEGGQLVGVRRPRPRFDRLGLRPGRGGEVGCGDARLARGANLFEQAELQPEIDQPRSGGSPRGWRSGRRIGRRGPSPRIVACGPPSLAGWHGYRSVMQRLRRARGSGV